MYAKHLAERLAKSKQRQILPSYPLGRRFDPGVLQIILFLIIYSYIQTNYEPR